MTIGITTEFLRGEVGVPGRGGAHYEVISQLAADHPDHQFCLFYAAPDAGFHPRFPSNVTLQKKPGYQHPLLQKFWYDLPLVRLLKRYKVDVLLSMEGYTSGTAKIPQCLLMRGSFAAHGLWESQKGGGRLYTWLLPGFLSRAGSVIVGSSRQKHQLESWQGSKGSKTEVVYGGVVAGSEVLPAEAKREVRQQFTEGMEYFIYEGPISTRQVLPLLKAFSRFKKRQQTSWKLVLSGGGIEEGFDKLMGSYKYRQDVVLAGSVKEEERCRLQGSAYGAIDTFTDHQSIAPALAWMERGVPYLAASGNPVSEISPDAALFFTADDPADMADRFMQLYKDEALHGALTEKGLVLCREYGWSKAADQIWEKLVQLHSSHH